MFFNSIISFFLEIDKNLFNIAGVYGALIYPLLFFVIFIETGLVFTPFLPGDSLLFAAGTIAGVGLLNVLVLFALLSMAAILGDTLNYGIGRYIGKRKV